MMYFKDCKTTQDVKKEFRRLTKLNHPDVFQDVAEREKANKRMIEIIKQYEAALKGATYEKVDNSHYKGMSEEEFAAFLSKEMKEVIDSIAHLPLDIEIIGTWLWVSGEEVHKYKAYLTAYDMRWHSTKKMYYWRLQQHSHYRRSRKDTDINDIRDTYGSKRVKNNERHAVTA